MSTLDTHKLAQALKQDAAVAALVADRVYPVKLPQGCVLPAITYQRVSGGQDSTLEGDSGLEFPRVQVSCWSKSYTQAHALAKAARGAMKSARAFRATTINDMDHYEDETGVYAVFVDFSIEHEE
ncbi:MAG: DUF3168 domain-containing protein [Desulfarculus sp.]|nr:DUF3168 domain-containing protein [Desulfarculus sp.]